MTYCVYISDSYSIERMETFWKTDMCSQNKSENISQWIGGEHYIQTSLYLSLKNASFCKIIYIDKPFNTDILLNAKYIIVPGWDRIPDTFRQYKSKMYTYRYFESSFEDFPDNHILTPYKYTGKNIFLPMSIIKLPDNDVSYMKYNSTGLLIGKCISHVVGNNKHTNLLKLLDNLLSPILSVLRPLHTFGELPHYLSSQQQACKEYSEKIINHKNIQQLGILNPKEFRQLLLWCKYCIFFYGAYSPPSILECLFANCIILSTRNVIPYDLLDNPNIIIIDDLSFDEINRIIIEIISGIRIFDTNNYPSDYTEEKKIDILQSYLN